MSEKNKTLTANNSANKTERKITKEAVAAKIVRVITVAPFMAALMLTVIWFARPESYLNFGHYLYALGALTIFPLLSYPVSVIIPPIRKKGRDGQRNLAIVFSVIGYIAGILGSVFSAQGELSFSFS